MYIVTDNYKAVLLHYFHILYTSRSNYLQTDGVSGFKFIGNDIMICFLGHTISKLLNMTVKLNAVYSRRGLNFDSIKRRT